MTRDTLVRGEGELASLLQPLPVDEVVARGVGHHHVHLHNQGIVSQQQGLLCFGFKQSRSGTAQI